MAILAWIVFEVLRTLAWDGHTTPEQLVFRSAGEMQKVWERDGGKADQMPKVDFEKETVLAVFAGEKSAGHTAKIELIVQGENDDKLIAFYRISAPAKEEPNAKKTCASHVAVIKKFAGTIHFLDANSAEGKEGLEQVKKKLKK